MTLILTLTVPGSASVICPDAQTGAEHVGSQWTTPDAPVSCNGLMECSVVTLGSDNADRIVREGSDWTSFSTTATVQQVSQPPLTPPPKA